MEQLFVMGAVAVCALVTAWAVTGLMGLAGPIQAANRRSSHVMPTPGSRGLGAAAGCAAGVLFGVKLGVAGSVAVLTGASGVGGALAAAGAALALGALDDVAELAAHVKFIVLAGVATAGVLVTGGPPDAPFAVLALPGLVALVMGAIWIFACANIVNFMDGVNGLVAGTSAIAAAALGVMAAALSQPAWMLACLALSAAWLGYLPWNARREAAVFMGDAGSLFTGVFLSLAVLALIAAAPRPDAALLFAPLVLAALLGDGLITLADRARRGAPLFQAHRDHGYQARVDAVRNHVRVSAGVWARSLVYSAAAVSGVVLQLGPIMGVCALVAAVVLEAACWRAAHRARPRH